MKVLMSDETHDDISSIFEYISRDSLKYANETASNIYSCINKLGISPYLGRYVPEFKDKRYREIIYKSYRIVYTVYEELDMVYIHFVIHGKRNLKSFYKSYISKN